MFSLKGKLKDLAGSAAQHLSARTIPVPQSAVNAGLKHAIDDVPEVDSLTLTIQDGHFEALAHVRKGMLMMDMRADATLRFAIERARISASEQWIELRQIGDMKLKGRDVADKIAIAIVEAVVFALLKVDPVEAATRGIPSVRRTGDLLHIDAAPMLPQSARQWTQKPWVKLGHVGEITCEPGRFVLHVKLGS